ncbi:PLP-dependent aminotransferase family protein [Catenulispora sp. NF23]|uniref:PLP-dependent aminotransferase family protein n=1 Tax=Catenulispora pinistramenti TaxID=2705254 RepID=A0ABS5KK86_9ACTN|nr:PLP-dependent aminotransferase family protein [Catenulispora pinistramenti]MBS2536551.1 PLP-dependent aminotransferase family protein [Catenulispora pinistramenti]MBS2545721.1 PLP-dependent aminotransferase family protein [Catenulispora pinistramenti]
MNEDSNWREVAEVLSREIAPLPVGTRIATHRELVKRFSASGTTVSQALALLTQRGLISSRPGAGTFRTQTRAVAPAADTSWQAATLELSGQDSSGSGTPRGFRAQAIAGMLTPAGPDAVDLNGGYLHPDLQPLTALTAALSRAARRPQAWDRPPAGGVPELRDWFAADIGGGLGRHDVLICGAGQSALATALRALAQPGDPVLIEVPTYPGVIAAALAAGLRAVPVPLDREGMRPDLLEQAFERTHARLAVVQPLFQNPTGACMPVARQREIRAIVRRHEAFVIEDDFARHLVHADGPAPAPPMIAEDPDGVVVHIRSLTKPTSPNLRVGALAARGPVLARLRSAHIIDSMFVPAPLQMTALEVVTAASWKRSLRTLAAALRDRREVTVAAVEATLGAAALALRPRGGYHLWAELPSHLDDEQFAAAALACGVMVTPGSRYYPSGDSTVHVRFSYIAAPSVPDIDEAVRRLAPLIAMPD